MSEYQYYEFQKVDGRLSEKEMQELRAYSTRARITPASFINEYHFGSFKGNVDTWMEKYFDGYLYLANWGTHEIQLAIPAGLISLATAERYCSSRVASSREKSGKLILTFLSEAEPDGEWLEGEGHLSALLQIRTELAHGDLRPLYLGWLIGVQADESKETKEEPPVPPNLDDLSGPQENLADFLRLDRDLLAAAAQNSPRDKPDVPSSEETSRWVASLPASEKDEMLVQVMEGAAARIRMELQSKFHRQQSGSRFTTAVKRRTVGELLSAAKAFGESRQRQERQKAALEKARQEQAAARAREKHLNSLAGRSESIWGIVDSLATTRSPKNYDEAVRHVADLRDLAEREGRQAEFKSGLHALRNQHGAKKSLIERLGGIVEGLYRARNANSDGALGWAPDFPIEQAGQVLQEFFRPSASAAKSIASQLFLESLATRVPEWTDMLRRTVNTSGKI